MKKTITMYLGCLMSLLFVSCGNVKNVEQLSVEVLSEYEDESTTESGKICIYIVGEIVCPGVYMLDEGSRICDAVNIAGGFTENAAKEYINLAEIMSDEEQIVIYSKEQVEKGEVTLKSEETLININTATKDMLMTLPGIGESRASDIISYRQQYGAFGSIEDIMKVSGIKEAAFSKIKDMITVR